MAGAVFSDITKKIKRLEPFAKEKRKNRGKIVDKFVKMGLHSWKKRVIVLAMIEAHQVKSTSTGKGCILLAEEKGLVAEGSF